MSQICSSQKLVKIPNLRCTVVPAGRPAHLNANDLLCLSLSNAAALIAGIEGCPQVNPLCFIEDFKAEWDDCVLAELTPEEEVWSQYMTEAFTKFAISGFVRIQYQSV